MDDSISAGDYYKAINDYTFMRTLAEFLRYIPEDREKAEVFITLVDHYGFSTKKAQAIQYGSVEYKLCVAAMKYRRTNGSH